MSGPASFQDGRAVVVSGARRRQGQARLRLPGSVGAPRAVSIRALLEWAFRDECASVEFGPAADIVNGKRAWGMEAVLIERAQLGCKPDGGGRSPSHPDADTVASAVAALPEARGGARMAIWLAELARAGAAPDWLPGATPRLLPVEWARNRWGDFARTAPAHTLGATGWPDVERKNRRGAVVREPVLYCPCAWAPSPARIAAARRGWLDWWGALLDLRGAFQVYGGLSAFVLTDEMPPLRPWEEKS